MNFLRSMMGSKKSEKKESKENDQDESTKDQSTENQTKDDINSNYSKCKAIPFPYIDTKESDLRVDNISLFDGKVLVQEKLNLLFRASVKLYQSQATEYNDNYRPEQACKSGGIEFANKEITALIRSAGGDIIKQIGKKILKGDFQLTTISFPIKVMIPLTILQSICRSFFQFPYYMHLAKDKDIVEKLKYTIVASISSFFCSSTFLKPLNPVLGETYECLFSDGSKAYLEQTSHHPPISHYQVFGPNSEWVYSGFSNYASSAGLNSCSVTNKGKRVMRFKDGTAFHFDFCKELFSNSFWGTLKLESLGEINYIEEREDLVCKIKIGQVKGKPSDTLSGEITHNGKVVATVSGSYLGHISFNGQRYWDIRENYPISVIEMDRNLPSSSIYRADRLCLEEDNIEKGQVDKDAIENIQRNDRKLREKYHGKQHK